MKKKQLKKIESLLILTVMLFIAAACSTSKNDKDHFSKDKRSIEWMLSRADDKNSDSILDSLVTAIDSAEESIDCSLSSLDERRASQIFIEKSKNGIPVRIAIPENRRCMDDGFLRLQYITEENLSLPENKYLSRHCNEGIPDSLLDSLAQNSFQVKQPMQVAQNPSRILVTKSEDSGFYENFCIVDNKNIYILSSGPSTSLFNMRNQIMITIENDPDVAAEFSSEMEQFINGTFGSNKQPRPVITGNNTKDGTFKILFGPSEKPIDYLNRHLRKVQHNLFVHFSSFQNTKPVFSDTENLALTLMTLNDSNIELTVNLDAGILTDTENAALQMLAEDDSLENRIFIYPSINALSNELSHYLPSNPFQHKADINIFILDQTTPDAKVIFYIGEIHSSSDKSDDSILISFEGIAAKKMIPEIIDTFENSSDLYENFQQDPSIEKGNIIVTEFMANPTGLPDALAEYVEIYNASDKTINLTGYRIETSQSSEIIMDAEVEPEEYKILCASQDPAGNGGIEGCLSIEKLPAITNSGGSITIKNRFGFTEDIVEYTSTREGVANELSVEHLDAESNNSAAFWGDSQNLYTSDNYGTPSSKNTFAISYSNENQFVDLSQYVISFTQNSSEDYEVFSLCDYDPYGHGSGMFQEDSYILIARSSDTYTEWQNSMIPDFSPFQSRTFFIDSGIAFNGLDGDNLRLFKQNQQIDETPIDSASILLQKNASLSWNAISDIENNEEYVPLFEAHTIFPTSEHELIIWAYAEDDVNGLFDDYRANFYLLYIPKID